MKNKVIEVKFTYLIEHIHPEKNFSSSKKIKISADKTVKIYDDTDTIEPWLLGIDNCLVALPSEEK